MVSLSQTEDPMLPILAVSHCSSSLASNSCSGSLVSNERDSKLRRDNGEIG